MNPEHSNESVLLMKRIASSLESIDKTLTADIRIKEDTVNALNTCASALSTISNTLEEVQEDGLMFLDSGELDEDGNYFGGGMPPTPPAPFNRS